MAVDVFDDADKVIMSMPVKADMTKASCQAGVWRIKLPKSDEMPPGALRHRRSERLNAPGVLVG